MRRERERGQRETAKRARGGREIKTSTSTKPATEEKKNACFLFSNMMKQTNHITHKGERIVPLSQNWRVEGEEWKGQRRRESYTLLSLPFSLSLSSPSWHAPRPPSRKKNRPLLLSLSLSLSLDHEKPKLLDVVEHGRAPLLHRVHPLEAGARRVDAARVGAVAVVGLFSSFYFIFLNRFVSFLFSSLFFFFPSFRVPPDCARDRGGGTSQAPSARKR